MANDFIELPVPPNDGVGASIDVSALGRFKTILASEISGSDTLTVLVEISEDEIPEDDSFAPIARFNKPDNLRSIEVVARFARVRVLGFVDGDTTGQIRIGADQREIPGPQGPQGVQGPQGAQGVQGPTGATGSSAILVFGAERIASQADTRFIPFGYVLPGPPSTSADAGFIMSRAGVLRNFFARHNTGSGNGNPIVYDIRINGVPQGLGLSLVTGAIGSASDLLSSFAANRGDLIECTATKALVIGAAGAVGLTFSCEIC